jgi:hypothetical protein
MNLRLGLRLYALFSSTLFVVFMATSSLAVAAGGVGALRRLRRTSLRKGPLVPNADQHVQHRRRFRPLRPQAAILHAHFQAGLRLQRPHL